MAQLRPQKLIIEAFKEQAQWIGSLLNPINLMFNDLILAFNNNLTISENFFQEIKEIKFKNQTQSFPLVFKTKFNSHPKGMTMIYAYDNTTSLPTILPAQVSWDFANGSMKITSITGLTANQTYTIRFLIIYG